MTCTEAGCAGTVLDDGYCDTCGVKGAGVPPPPAAATAPAAAPAIVEGAVCAEAGCGGHIDAGGWCDTCGTKAAPASIPSTGAEAAATAQGPLGPGIGSTSTASTATPSLATAATGPASAGPVTSAASAARTSQFTSGSRVSGGSRRQRDSTRTRASQRQSIGGDLVTVPTAPSVDPATIVRADAEVAERKRFCGNCGDPVGRAHEGRPGRLQGFCGNCRTRFDFVPKLQPGQLVGGQYEVAGPLAHGGLGWIYLGRDTAVSGRWVVLKGLLNAGDEAAMAAAVAERRFLAEVQHPNIVEIYNFVSYEGAGYTVMEYVGGPSLKSILKDRREQGLGPLGVAEALAFMLAVAPAFSYLHRRGFLYCDFKPDNVIQVGDDVKLIDLGGVRRLDDQHSDIYGTVGFQAPEVAEVGPSISSDVYTIGRTLAVLTMDFRGYTSIYVDSLPDPAEHPALRDHDAFLRLLRKATAPHPDDRFQSVDELVEAMAGVLRMVVSRQTGTPRPGPSQLFAGPPGPGQELPWLAVDPQDPAAAYLARLPVEPAEALTLLDAALSSGQITDTVEVRLRRASDLVELGQTQPAMQIATAILAQDPWEWRAIWVQGFAALAEGQLPAAASAFDRCRSEAPGELAPLYASARVAEAAGEIDRATALYDLVSSVDPSWTAAAFGLARVRTAASQPAEAVQALDRVPATHRAHGDAQQAAVKILTTAGRLDEAGNRANALTLEGPARDRLDVRLLSAALVHAQQQGGGTADAELRDRLENAYRRLARSADSADRRESLVDAANAVRRRTLF